MREVDEVDKPLCSCGSRMELSLHQGYYDDVYFWECKNGGCHIMEKYEDFKPEEVENNYMGSYT